jgi:hypothetical protein
MANLSLVISAKNLTGGAFTSLQNSLGQTNKLVGGFKSQLSGVGGAIASYRTEQARVADEGVQAFGGLNTSLLLVAGTVGVLSQAFGGLKNSIGGAIDRQVDNLGSINTAISVLGLSEKQAGQYVQSFNKQAALLGSNLPTDAEKISVFARTITDDYAGALKGLGANASQIQQVLLGDSSRLALAAQLGNVDTNNAKSNVQSYLAGGVGLAGLKGLTLFGSNPLLTSGIEKGLRSTGAGDLTQLSAAQRIKILSSALEAAITPDAIARLQKTAKAQISGFMDRLFDPEIGIFSIQRDLDAKTDGYQSVFSSFEKTLDLVIGDKGVLAQLGRLTGLSGIDPMVRLKGAVEGFNGFLEGMVNTFSKLKVGDTSGIGGAVGKFAAKLANSVFDGILGAVASIDWGATLKGVGVGIGSFLTNLDWKIYAAGAVGLIGAALVPSLVGAAVLYGGTIVGVVAAGLAGFPVLVGGAIALGVVAIGKLVVDNWGAIKGAAIATGKFLLSGFQSFMGLIGGLFEAYKNYNLAVLQFFFGKEGTQKIIDFGKSVIGVIGASFNVIGSFVSQSVGAIGLFFQELGKAFGQIFNAVGDALKATIDVIRSLIDSVVKPIQSGISSLAGTVTSSFQTVQNTGGVVGAIANPSKSVLGAALNPLGAVTQFAAEKLFGARYMGQVPSAANCSELQT